VKHIFTWSFAPAIHGARLNTKPNKFEWLVFVYLAEKAISQVNKLFGRPIVYTDSIGAYLFEDMPCDVVCCYDNVHKDVDVRLWAYAKILTYQAQKEPYVHYDLDFICKRHFELPKADIVVQCSDTYQDTYTKDLDATGLELPKPFIELNGLLKNSWTVGIMAMADMSFNHLYADMSREYFERNSANMDKVICTTMANCVLEQQLLALLALNEGKAVEPLTTDGRFVTEDFEHFVSYAKSDSMARYTIGRFIEQRHYDLSRKIMEKL